MFVLFLMVLVCFIFNVFSCNIFIWWSTFLIMTLLFVLINKSNYSFHGLLNYFVIQEFLGLVFLLLNFSYFQLFVLFLKVGVSPFHFWIFSVVNSIYGWGVLWFLTFQKLPFFPVILYFLDFSFYFVILLGIFVCYFQLFVLKSYKSLLVISSTESFNWIIFLAFFSIFNGFLFFCYYIVLMFFLIEYSSKKNQDFFSWELVLLFMNIPLSLNFFIKIFSFISLLDVSSFVFLFVLFLMFLSMLCFGFWLVNMSTKFYFYNVLNFNSFYFFIYPVMFLCLI
uniref:NADH dehydrogenase subunit 2 n=1 Tax=Parastrongyloides trichosuri TaxID=131310 RepID=A0A0S3M447_PARTI|nr:NADH dehydrogenase subunit 2 [Parastrongyloides trichosuri]BAT21169.1 NADH dehydrogenase subunit 2 [Parastrongyloides trichosuri]